MIVLFYLLYKNLKLIKKNPQQAKNAPINVDDINNFGREKRDCERETIFCSSNQDCVDSCATDYNCNSTLQICEPTIIEVPYGPDDQVCNEQHGSSWAISVDPILGEMRYCIRRLGYLYDRQDKLWPHVCSGGTFDVNVFNRLPKITDCSCPSNTVLAYHVSTPLVPRCVPQIYLDKITSLVPVND